LPSKLPVVAVITPVTTTPAGFACAFTFPPLSLIEVASIPVSADPSPENDVAVSCPEFELKVRLVPVLGA
jgi:hypothetical protein